MNAKQVVESWVAAFNRADVDGLAGLYHEEAVRSPRAGDPQSGRAAVVSALERELSLRPRARVVERIHVGEAEEVEWAALEWREGEGCRGCSVFYVRWGQIVLQRDYRSGLREDPAQPGSSSKVTISDLERHGLRQVKVVRPAEVEVLIKQAVADVLGRDADEDGQIAAEAQGELGRLLAEQRNLQALQKELAAQQAEVEAAHEKLQAALVEVNAQLAAQKKALRAEREDFEREKEAFERERGGAEDAQ